MTTAKATGDVLRGKGPRPEARWWLVAGSLLGLSLAAVLGVTIVRTSDGHIADAPAAIVVDGADLVAMQGSGRKDQTAFVLEAPGADRMAVLGARLAPFHAEDFSRVEWKVASAQPPELALAWRTREHPKRTFSKPLRWLVTGPAPLELTAADGWSGTITGIALLAGGMTAPLRVASLRIDSRSAIQSAEGLARQWAAPTPLKGYSVNYPFDAERAHDLPVLLAIAIAEGLAFGAYLLLARWRRWPRDARVLWGIFLGGWLLLDLRWQASLWREAAARGARFAGKSTAEMHLAADDAALYTLVEQMKGGLPAKPSRIFLYCDNENLCARAAFLLYPQNVYRTVHPRRTLPAPEELHEGDHVLLVYTRALGYDRERHAAIWHDGRSKPADEVAQAPGALLLRIR